MAAVSSDRVLYWPILLSVAWPVTLVLVSSGPLGTIDFLGAPLILVAWALSAVASMVLCIGWIAQRAWRRSFCTMILPVTALAAALNLGFVWWTSKELGAYVHFYAMRPFYLTEIAKLPTSEPRLMVYNWGGIFLHSTGVVYDESDEITSEHPSQNWLNRTGRTDLACRFGYMAMGNHFYLVGFDC
jgi:hypothetical protein